MSDPNAKLAVMPSKGPTKTLQEVIDAVGVYPEDAYVFVQEGLNYTVSQVHQNTAADASHHVGGRELCGGLRELALKRWGLLARTVLERWNITSTMDFGRIVFAMVDHDMLQKTDEDSIDDFRQVYDFRTAFESDYRIEPKVLSERPKRTERQS
jgi:uncharacterized repeat protein (TIGR04138 family)